MAGAVESPGRATAAAFTCSNSALFWLLVGEAGTLRDGALLAAKVLTVGMTAPHTSLPSGSRGRVGLHLGVPPVTGT